MAFDKTYAQFREQLEELEQQRDHGQTKSERAAADKFLNSSMYPDRDKIETIFQTDYLSFLELAFQNPKSWSPIVLTGDEKDEDKVQRYHVSDPRSKDLVNFDILLPKYDKMDMLISQLLNDTELITFKSKYYTLKGDDIEKFLNNRVLNLYEDVCNRRLADLENNGQVRSWGDYLGEIRQERDAENERRKVFQQGE